MNLALVIQNYNYQGGGQVTASLAERFESLGHNVNVIAIRCDQDDIKSRPSQFNKIIDLHASGFLSSIFKLLKIFSKSNYDICLTIGGYSNLSAGLAKFISRTNITIIGSEHFAKSVLIGDYTKPLFRLFFPFFRFAYAKLNGLIFVSDKLREEFLNKNLWHPSRCITIYNPVRSFKKKSFEDIKIKRFSGLTFLGVGILEQRKRFDLLLKSFSIVANINDKLLLAGSGSLQHQLKNLAKKLSIESQVHFLGYVEDIESLMNKSDILVLTSDSEAFGMVLVEGLSSGLQVVSTECFAGPAEILGNGRYGFLAKVDNLDSIVSSIRTAIKNPLPHEIIQEGASRFSTESIVNQYLNFIKIVKKSEGNLYDPI